MTTNPFDFSDTDPADLAVAEIIAADVKGLMVRAVSIASAYGTEITTSQILGGVLAYGMAMAPTPITREDYLSVYDEVVRLREYAPGPEETAHAANDDEAGEMASRWGQRISDVALGFNVEPI